MDGEERKVSSKEKDSDESIITFKLRNNPWILTTIVLSILSLVLIFGNFNFTGKAVLSENEASQSVIDYYESQGIFGLSFVSAKDLGDFYEVTLNYEGQSVPFYVTKSGYLAGNSIVPLDGNYEEFNSADYKPLDISADDDAILGNSNALVEIIEFSDYECPFCARHFDETLPLVIKNYVDTGKVKIILRDFPLSFHPYAQKAAEATECAGEFGDDKYWKYHDKLFENQDALDIASLKKYAVELGLDSAEFNNCLDSGQMESEVLKDLRDGESYGVSGTPGFFINGIPLEGAQPYSEFERVIESELNKF